MTTRQARIEKYVSADGLWRWRCVAPNGRIVSDSAESYSSERAVDRGIARNAEYIGYAIRSGRITTGKRRA